MSTLEEIRDRCEVMLMDTGNAIWDTGTIDEAIRLALALGAESALVNGVVKSAFRRERPIHDADQPHQLRQPLTSSFPSGHASAAFLACFVPGVNLLMIPALVVGGTLLVLRHPPEDVSAPRV